MEIHFSIGIIPIPKGVDQTPFLLQNVPFNPLKTFGISFQPNAPKDEYIF